MHGAELRGHASPKGVFSQGGRFGRLYPHLRSLKTFTEAQAVALGAAGGPMDGGAGIDPTQDNPNIPAGFTFLGQFLDHDITFDPTSSLETQNDPAAVRNFRTPAFELDSVYGAGPAAQPYLYDGQGAFLLSENGVDLQRNRMNRAVIGDPRNDENLIISQLHCAFLRFHNAVLATVGGDFEEAQRLVRWHYQWIILHEFLPLTCGGPALESVLDADDLAFPGDGEAFMPVEFSVAAYRFGHSQVRPGYRINANFAAGLFPAAADAPPGNDLRGGQPVGPERAVDWSNFFGAGAQRSKRIDHRISTPLLGLPNSVVPPSVLGPQRSLATRNLLRSQRFGLPSGQAVARYLGEPVVTPERVWNIPQGGQFSGEAPLWFYILREAALKNGGRHLGPVGARIVAEVFLGLLRADTASFLNHEPGWTPTLEGEVEGDFMMTDLLRVAGLT